MSKRFVDSKNSIKGRSVEVRDDFNRALRVFSKKIQETGILREVKERDHYEKNGTANTRMKRAARKRWEKKVEGMITNGDWHQDKPY